MHTVETFVLSNILSETDLPRFIDWHLDLKARKVRYARLDITLGHEHLPFALTWHRHFTASCPGYLIGNPFLETRIKGGNSLSGLLVWFSSCRRSVIGGTVVTIPHFLEFGSPLYDRLHAAISRHVRFTDRDAWRFGDAEAYRDMRATAILSGSRITTVETLTGDFGGVQVDDAKATIYP